MSYLITSSNLFLRDFESYYFAGRDIVKHDTNIYSLDVKYQMAPKPFPELNGLLTPNINGSSSSILENPATNIEIPEIKQMEDVTGLKAKILNPLFSPPYIYPPLLAYLMHPLSHFNIYTGYIIWNAILTLCLILIPYSGIRILEYNNVLNNRLSHLLVLFLSPLLFVFVIYDNFYWSQVNLIVVFLLMISFLYMDAKPNIAAISFSLSFLIKMNPILIIFYFFLIKKYNFILRIIFFTIVFIGITFAMGGYHHWVDFLRIISDISKDNRAIRGLFPVIMEANLSIKAFIYKIFSWKNPWISYYSYFISAFLLGYSVLQYFPTRTSRNQKGNSCQFEMNFTCKGLKINSHKIISESILLFRLVILLLVSSPIFWFHHSILLYINFIILLYLFFTFNFERIRIILLSLLFILTLFPLHFKFPIPQHKSNIYFISLYEGYNLVLMLILFFSIEILLKQNGRDLTTKD